jgi:hypothetical protein
LYRITYIVCCWYIMCVIMYRYCVHRLATGWTVWGSNPGGGEIFRTRREQLWGPPSPLYNRYRVTFPWVKRPVRGVDHTPPSIAEVKERVELCVYSICDFMADYRVKCTFIVSTGIFVSFQICSSTVGVVLPSITDGGKSVCGATELMLRCLRYWCKR